MEVVKDRVEEKKKGTKKENIHVPGQPLGG